MSEHSVTRVVVTGSESTGKTVLARELAAQFETLWVPEYGREYSAQRGGVLTAHDIEEIARGHLRLEDEYLQRLTPRSGSGARSGDDRPLLILDTDLVSTTVYAEQYYGECPSWVMREARARLGDLYLLCDIDLEWEADGIRDLPHARAQVHVRFLRRLEELGARMVTIAGTGEERRRRAIAAVERSL
jgi:NadR type nicotinamide-nucleotide adenylyltransferase